MVPENEAVVRRFFDELWSQGRLEVADELIAADHVHLSGEPVRGPDGVRDSVGWLRAAFPDLHFELDELISDADRVVVRWTATGTHRGTFADLPPTGRHVSWTGTDWIKLRDQQVIEVRAIVDGGALFEQLTAAD